MPSNTSNDILILVMDRQLLYRRHLCPLVLFVKSELIIIILLFSMHIPSGCIMTIVGTPTIPNRSHISVELAMPRS